MADDKLQEFFKKKKNGHPSVDWFKKRDDWIKAVEVFYEEKVKDILKDSIEDGSVSVSFDEITISEEYIGKYKIREMKLQIGDQTVKLSPKGCNIIGASGRIDLIGALGQKTIVMQPGSRWSIVITRTPTLKVEPFEETLLEALEEIML